MAKRGRVPKDIQPRYEEVLALVNKGLTISKALKKLNIHSWTFYNKISQDQKRELGYGKTLFTIYGQGAKGKWASVNPINYEFSPDLESFDDEF